MGAADWWNRRQSAVFFFAALSSQRVPVVLLQFQIKIRRAKAPLALSFLVVAVTVHADIVLPTGGFNGGGLCGGSASPIPALNGRQGVGLQVTCVSTGTSSAVFQFDVDGPLTGGSLPFGTVIPFTFSFNAVASNPGITSITGAGIQAVGNLLITSSQEQTVKNGPCGQFTNTCWQLQEFGTGTMITGPSDISNGSLMELGVKSSLVRPTVSGLRILV